MEEKSQAQIKSPEDVKEDNIVLQEEIEKRKKRAKIFLIINCKNNTLW